MSPVVSLPCLTLKQSLDHLEELRIPSMNSSPRRRSNGLSSSGFSDQPANDDEEGEEDYVRIPKREYEAIKHRVSAIEKRISREFELVQTTKQSDLSSTESAGGGGGASSSNPVQDDVAMTSPPLGGGGGTVKTIANVQDEYQRALEETDQLNRSTGGTDELAKRLGRDLKIRRSAEHKIIRSPSARKIGSIRRRSRDHSSTSNKLNRTMSLNITTTTDREKKRNRCPEDEDGGEMDGPLGAFYPRQTSNLKRGRPNTILTGLRVHRSPPESRRARDTLMEEATMRRRSATMTAMTTTKPTPLISSLNEFYPGAAATISSTGVVDEVWTDAKDFFAEKQQPQPLPPPVTPKRFEASERRGSLRSAGKATPSGPGTPKAIVPNPEDNLLKTPMLPPKRAPRKTPGSSMAKNHYLTPLQQAQQTGRASIARIRSQNAGMVLAKARLFNDLGTDEVEKTGAGPAVPLEIRRAVTSVGQKENRETPKTYVSSFRRPQIKPVLLANSPRRIVKTPSRERATPVRALPRSPRQGPQGRSAAARQQF